MRLVGAGPRPRLVTIKSGQDHTCALKTMTASRIKELEELDLSGYVFKKDSPSCGMERVRVYHRHGPPSRNGTGIFARAFIERFPLIPVEEEGRLRDPILRDNFIERVFSYRRWQDLLQAGVTRQALVRFHTTHRYLLLAHNPAGYRILDRLIGQADRYRPSAFARRYGTLFMKALAVKATARKHVNVLHHIMGYLKSHLGAKEKTELLGAIEDYREGLTPLLVPLTLAKHYVQSFDVSHLRDQAYLNPHPKELMLRHHV